MLKPYIGSICLAFCLVLLFLPFTALAEETTPPHWAVPGAITAKQVGPGNYGGMVSIAIHPQIPSLVLASADMGATLVRSLDGGVTWEQAKEAPGSDKQIPMGRTRFIIINPNNPMKAWTADSGGLYESTNVIPIGQGAPDPCVFVNITDDKVGLPDRFSERLFVFDTDVEAVAYGLTVLQLDDAGAAPQISCYRTLNGGDSWEERAEFYSVSGDPDDIPGYEYPYGIKDVYIDPNSNLNPLLGRARMFVWGNGGVLRSDDHGLNFQYVNGSGNDVLPRGIVAGGSLVHINSAGPGPSGFTRLYTYIWPRRLQSGGWIGGVFKSDDLGGTWIPCNGDPEGDLCAALDLVAGTKTKGERDIGPDMMDVIGLRSCTMKFEKDCDFGEGLGYVTVKPGNGTGIFKTANGGSGWDLVLPKTSGQKTMLDGSPGGGKTKFRVPINPDLPVDAIAGHANTIAISESDPNVVMTASVTMLRTEDGFSTSPADCTTIVGERFQPQDRFVELGNQISNYTHRIKNRGMFNQVVHDMDCNPFDSDGLAIAYTELGLRITHNLNNGEEWRWSNWGNEDHFYYDYTTVVRYDRDVGNKMWTGIFSHHEPGYANRHLYKSTDRGKSFQGVAVTVMDTRFNEQTGSGINYKDLGNTPGVWDIAHDPDDPNTFYVASTVGLFKTSNAGASFIELADLGDALNLDPLADNPYPDVWRVRPFKDFGQNSSLLVGILHDQTWYHVVAGYGTYDTEYPRGLYRSVDGGTTFSQVLGSGQHTIGGVISISICESYESVQYVTAYADDWRPEQFHARAVLFKSQNFGASFTPIDINGIEGEIFPYAVAVCPENKDIVYVTTYAKPKPEDPIDKISPHFGMYKSTDGGEEWTRVQGIRINKRSGIRFDPNDHRRLFVFDQASAHVVWDLEDL